MFFLLSHFFASPGMLQKNNVGHFKSEPAKNEKEFLKKVRKIFSLYLKIQCGNFIQTGKDQKKYLL